MGESEVMMTRPPLSPKTQYRKAYRLVRMHTDREIMLNTTLFAKEVAYNAMKSYNLRRDRGYAWHDLLSQAKFMGGFNDE
jgi:hypothetical protein